MSIGGSIEKLIRFQKYRSLEGHLLLFVTSPPAPLLRGEGLGVRNSPSPSPLRRRI